ncbi:X-Pro dipeptidyl-peptidase domain-containing protein, putative [Eimeria maxima]|uniref:X-Pro dipeptidyl-peptidase domain-containing protein, putative n=1 Tax=Eimeria maxima TaxID=5804 RepID=U6LWG9_EIMMA|nr:X-Pro dipeptidyl-peptidase domain-containing protein, putative [Eimeria maxima]CDJ56312.1 X-Pro dipeptidyl-peptidase domain-containing protein, putative [Eimeria maxima]
MTEAVSSVQFYDDFIQFNEYLYAQPSSFGITHNIMQKIAQKKVSVLAVGGFCDSATARGAIRLFSHIQENAPETRQVDKGFRV